MGGCEKKNTHERAMYYVGLIMTFSNGKGTDDGNITDMNIRVAKDHHMNSRNCLIVSEAIGLPSSVLSALTGSSFLVVRICS